MSFKKALSIIFISLLCTTSMALGALWYWQNVQKQREGDPQYKIVALAQSTTSGEPLKSTYLAELLGLSTDQPQNLYQFDSREALAKLNGSALIKKGSITKIKPGTLLIDYEVRQPIAFSGDFSNTAIDEEGFLIPFKPFFTPKKLPLLILGEQDDENGKWGKPLSSRKAKLALEVLTTIQQAIAGQPLQLLQLDLSRAYALSFGQREIIALIETKRNVGSTLWVTPIYLRLSLSNYRQELSNFLKLSYELSKLTPQEEKKGIINTKPLMIELRVPQLAFVVSESQSK